MQWDKTLLENNRDFQAGEHERGAEMLKNQMKDLESMTRLKAESEGLRITQEHLRYGFYQTLHSDSVAFDALLTITVSIFYAASVMPWFVHTSRFL